MVQLPSEKVALDRSTLMLSSSHVLTPPGPRLKWCPPHEPPIIRQPQFASFSFDAQKETLAHLRFVPPTRATMCASVMKDPSTVSLPPCSLKEAASVFTFTARLGADKKL